MDLIYQNFDGLDVTFQGRVSERVRHMLEEGRQEAEQSPRGLTPGLVWLDKDTPIEVASTGMRGGYRYRFDTGLDGETWCVANSDDAEQWNIRVSLKSLSLALYGYKGVKERLYNMLDKLEATGSGEINLQTGEVYIFPKAAISRVDYCFDFKTEDFQINPELLIAHMLPLSGRRMPLIYPG